MQEMDNLLEILKDLRTVFEYLREEPEWVMPRRHHEVFSIAVDDSLLVLQDLDTKVKNFKNSIGKSLVDFENQVDPKGKSVKAKKAVKEEGERLFREFKEVEQLFLDAGLLEAKQMNLKYAICKHTMGDLLDNSFIPLPYTNDIDTEKKEKSKVKNPSKYWKRFIPPLKRYLKSSGAVIGSLSKVFGVSEKLSEVIKMVTVGIDLVEPYFIKKY